MAEFGSIEALLARLDESNAKAAENLRQHADMARRAVPGHVLQTPITVTLQELMMGAPRLEELRALYEELEFRADLQALGSTPGVSTPPVAKRYRSITTLEELEAEIAALRQADSFAVDTETTSQDPMRAELVGLSLAHKPHEAVYIPLRHSYLGVPVQLDATLVLERLRPLLEDLAIPKYGQNIKYDYIVLQRHGITMRGLDFDTMVAGYLLNPSRRMNNLDALAREYLNYTPISYEEVAGKGARQVTFDQVDITRATTYSAEDADVALLLTQASLQGQWPDQLMFQEVEMPLVEVLAALERCGVMVDAAYLRQMSQHLQVQMEALLQEIFTQVGEEFNINSPPQLQHILFDVLQLPTGKKTKTGYSTDVSVLENLALEHDLPRLILDYRHLAKMKSTYVDALPQMIHPQTGRIHTSFNQTITETGRLSSSNPNLQNIPIRSDLGREMRRAFVAASGHVLVSADYSQIELRLLAHMSGDPVLIDAFRSGQDIHARTAMEVFGVDGSAVDSDMRRMAKTVNFGILYGLSPFGLAQRLRISNEAARTYIDGYFARYPRVKECLDGILASARQQGYVTTLLQRRRYLPDIINANRTIREAAERTAINMPFQGSAADLIKLAMVHLYHQIVTEHLPCHMLPDSRRAALRDSRKCGGRNAPRITETMENVWQLVPSRSRLARGHMGWHIKREGEKTMARQAPEAGPH
jgi:DNA polymerase-1